MPKLQRKRKEGEWAAAVAEMIFKNKITILARPRCVNKAYWALPR